MRYQCGGLSRLADGIVAGTVFPYKLFSLHVLLTLRRAAWKIQKHSVSLSSLFWWRRELLRYLTAESSRNQWCP
jgi:hypothetical protein